MFRMMSLPKQLQPPSPITSMVISRQSYNQTLSPILSTDLSVVVDIRNYSNLRMLTNCQERMEDESCRLEMNVLQVIIL